MQLFVDSEAVTNDQVTRPEFTWEPTVEYDHTREQNWIPTERLFERDETMRSLTPPIYPTDDGTPV